MRKLLTLVFYSYKVETTYKFNFFFTLIGNIISIVFIYFLWRSVYLNNTTLNSMSFKKTFVHLSIGSTLFWAYQCYVDWTIYRSIITGNIINRLLRPIDLQTQLYFETLGTFFFKTTFILLPSLLSILIIQRDFRIGLNIISFSVSVILAFSINFNIDFLIGLLSISTESLWGIIMIKETIVLILSGAVIPITFFPFHMQKTIELLPFYSIYNAPISIINSNFIPTSFTFKILSTQVFWILATLLIDRVLVHKLINGLRVNGG